VGRNVGNALGFRSTNETISVEADSQSTLFIMFGEGITANLAPTSARWAVVEVFSGTTGGCFSLQSGDAVCLGLGTSGRLGNGASANSSLTTPVTWPSAITDIGHLILVATNTKNTCALWWNGNGVTCWGDKVFLGTSDNVGDGAASSYPLSNEYTYWTDTEPFMIDMSETHLCAIFTSPVVPDSSGVICVGDNSVGQAGTGSLAASDMTNHAETLDAVAISVHKRVNGTFYRPVDVSVSETVSCVVYSAAEDPATDFSSHRVVCWGHKDMIGVSPAPTAHVGTDGSYADLDALDWLPISDATSVPACDGLGTPHYILDVTANAKGGCALLGFPASRVFSAGQDEWPVRPSSLRCWGLVGTEGKLTGSLVAPQAAPDLFVGKGGASRVTSFLSPQILGEGSLDKWVHAPRAMRINCGLATISGAAMCLAATGAAAAATGPPVCRSGGVSVPVTDFDTTHPTHFSFKVPANFAALTGVIKGDTVLFKATLTDGARTDAYFATAGWLPTLSVVSSRPPGAPGSFYPTAVRPAFWRTSRLLDASYPDFLPDRRQTTILIGVKASDGDLSDPALWSLISPVVGGDSATCVFTVFNTTAATGVVELGRTDAKKLAAASGRSQPGVALFACAIPDWKTVTDQTAYPLPLKVRVSITFSQLSNPLPSEAFGYYYDSLEETLPPQDFPSRPGITLVEASPRTHSWENSTDFTYSLNYSHALLGLVNPPLPSEAGVPVPVSMVILSVDTFRDQSSLTNVRLTDYDRYRDFAQDCAVPWSCADTLEFIEGQELPFLIRYGNATSVYDRAANVTTVTFSFPAVAGAIGVNVTTPAPSEQAWPVIFLDPMEGYADVGGIFDHGFLTVGGCDDCVLPSFAIWAGQARFASVHDGNNALLAFFDYDSIDSVASNVNPDASVVGFPVNTSVSFTQQAAIPGDMYTLPNGTERFDVGMSYGDYTGVYADSLSDTSVWPVPPQSSAWRLARYFRLAFPGGYNFDTPAVLWLDLDDIKTLSYQGPTGSAARAGIAAVSFSLDEGRHFYPLSIVHYFFAPLVVTPGAEPVGGGDEVTITGTSFPASASHESPTVLLIDSSGDFTTAPAVFVEGSKYLVFTMPAMKSLSRLTLHISPYPAEDQDFLVMPNALSLVVYAPPQTSRVDPLLLPIPPDVPVKLTVYVSPFLSSPADTPRCFFGPSYSAVAALDPSRTTSSQLVFTCTMPPISMPDQALWVALSPNGVSVPEAPGEVLDQAGNSLNSLRFFAVTARTPATVPARAGASLTLAGAFPEPVSPSFYACCFRIVSAPSSASFSSTSPWGYVETAAVIVASSLTCPVPDIFLAGANSTNSTARALVGLDVRVVSDGVIVGTNVTSAGPIAPALARTSSSLLIEVLPDFEALSVAPPFVSSAGGTRVVVMLSAAAAPFFAAVAPNALQAARCLFADTIRVLASEVDPVLRTVTCITPSSTSGPASVEVSLDEGASFSSGRKAQATFYSFTLLQPTWGPAAGGSNIIVRGQGVSQLANITCLFAAGGVGTAASASAGAYLSSVSVACTSPPSAGATSVSLAISLNGNMDSSPVPGTFSFYPTPVVASISPTSGPGSVSQRITLFGLNFAATAGSVYQLRCRVGPFAGTVAHLSPPSTTTIMCIIPVVNLVVAEVSVSLNDQDYSTNGPSFRFISFSDLEPRLGPTAGGTLLTIRGQGLDPAVTSYKCIFSTAEGATVTTPAVAVSSSALTCPSPGGASSSGLGRRQFGALATAPSSPMTLLVTSNDGSTGISVPVTFVYTSPALAVTAVRPASGPAAGGHVVTLFGVNLPLANSSAAPVFLCRFGAGTPVPAAQASSDPSVITCLAPALSAGLASLDLSVNNGRDFVRAVVGNSTAVYRSELCPAGTFTKSYLEPCQPCGAGTSSSVNGANECPPCPRTSYQDRTGQTSCQKCPDNTQVPIGVNASSVSACECLEGFYSEQLDRGVPCKACPFGGRCAGGVAPPLPQRGFWSSSKYPYLFLRCLSDGCASDSSTGPEFCAGPYRNRLCGGCLPGYYSSNSVCKPCPRPWVTYLLASLFFLFIVFIALALVAIVSRRSALKSGATIGIIVQNAQVLGIIGDMNIGWDPRILRALEAIKAPFQLSIDALGFECVSPSYGYQTKWLLALAIPLYFSLVFLSSLALASVHAWYFRANAGLRDRFRDPHRHKDGLFDKMSRWRRNFSVPVHMASYRARILNASLMVFLLSFLFMVKIDLQHFDCTLKADGAWSLDASAQLNCFTGWWYRLLPVAVIFLLLYAIAIPVAIFGSLRRHLWRLRAPEIAVKYGSVYGNYSSRRPLWEVVVMVEKLLIGCVALFFSAYPTFQLNVLLIVLMCALILAYSVKPYWFLRDNHLNGTLRWCTFGVLLVAMIVRDGSFSNQLASSITIAVFFIILFVICATVLVVAVVDAFALKNVSHTPLQESVFNYAIHVTGLPHGKTLLLTWLESPGISVAEQKTLLRYLKRVYICSKSSKTASQQGMDSETEVIAVTAVDVLTHRILNPRVIQPLALWVVGVFRRVEAAGALKDPSLLSGPLGEEWKDLRALVASSVAYNHWYVLNTERNSRWSDWLRNNVRKLFNLPPVDSAPAASAPSSKAPELLEPHPPPQGAGGDLSRFGRFRERTHVGDSQTSGWLTEQILRGFYGYSGPTLSTITACLSGMEPELLASSHLAKCLHLCWQISAVPAFHPKFISELLMSVLKDDDLVKELLPAVEARRKLMDKTKAEYDEKEAEAAAAAAAAAAGFAIEERQAKPSEPLVDASSGSGSSSSNLSPPASRRSLVVVDLKVDHQDQDDHPLPGQARASGHDGGVKPRSARGAAAADSKSPRPPSQTGNRSGQLPWQETRMPSARLPAAGSGKSPRLSARLPQEVSAPTDDSTSSAGYTTTTTTTTTSFADATTGSDSTASTATTSTSASTGSSRPPSMESKVKLHQRLPWATAAQGPHQASSSESLTSENSSLEIAPPLPPPQKRSSALPWLTKKVVGLSAFTSPKRVTPAPRQGEEDEYEV
jgi:hypothetical protein